MGLELVRVLELGGALEAVQRFHRLGRGATGSAHLEVFEDLQKTKFSSSLDLVESWFSPGFDMFKIWF